jgi:hypothetical protein
MYNQLSTDMHLNKLIQFRQALYDSGFTKLRDAQFELLDALLLSGPVRSFAELSLSPIFRRQWPSVYAAMEDGHQDTQWLKGYLCTHVPTQGVQLFALDGTAWPRPKAYTLPDRQYLHTSTSAVDGSTIIVGYPYSMLSWVAQDRSSWALPVDIQRIPSSHSVLEVGVAQVKELCQGRKQHLSQSLDIIVADGRYGTQRFLGPLRDQPCGVLVRLRRDRVLYRPPPPYSGRGRPRQHGERFAFKEPYTWGEPEQSFQFQDPHWGKVDIRYWSGLHDRKAPDAPLGVLRIGVHLEKEHPPDALWLGWQGPAWPAEALWRYYQWRWPIEPSIRWRKQKLHWTMPQFQSEGACERWSMLVSLAQWLIYLARPLVWDRPLPWQKVQAELTPGRVQQGLGGLFAQIGTPARPSKRRGKSPGWAKERHRRRPTRYPVVKKGAKKPKSSRKAA